MLISVNTGAFDVERSLDELRALSDTAGAEVVATVTQNRESYDNATCIGRGRLEEIAVFCAEQAVDLLIFDCELTATQTRNVEEITRVRAIDRTTLILDIFARHARTREGKLQVELAQQRYRLPRLAGMGASMSRLGAGIGTRGPGETKLETDRRHIRSRIRALESELNKLEQRRARMHERRRKEQVQTVAIVGYTNAGKSTLLNALTGAEVLAQDKLFATLDPTARALELPDGRSVLLVDTVGLISRLPHHLIEAFKSTLEEAAQADLILHLCDASSDELESQMRVTERLLAELDCAQIPTLTVLNKCDRIPRVPDLPPDGRRICISAKTGFGLDALQNAICDALEPTARRMTLRIPYAQAQLCARIRASGKLFSERYTEDGILLDALVDCALFDAVRGFQVGAQENPD